MSERWTVEWRYTPADFFVRPFSQCVAGQLFEVGQGCVKAAIDTLHREWSESLPDALELAVTLVDEAGAGAGILVAGSVILAGEARALLVRNDDEEDQR